MKQRLTVSVDGEVVEAARAAVRAGRAVSVSAWVNEALADRAATDDRLVAMAEAVAAYEAEFGPITEEQLRAQEREDRAAAAAVRAKALARLEAQQKKRGRRAG